MLNDRALIYLHIPKTAGTTMSHIVDGYFDEAVIYPRKLLSDMPADENELRAELAGKRLIRGHIPAGVSAYLDADPTWMTMLRDPVERVVSVYYFMRAAATRLPPEKWTPAIQIAQAHSLEHFIVHPGPDDPKQNMMQFTENGMCRFLARWWVGDGISEDVLSQAKAAIDRCTFVGIAERFAESVTLMCHTFGWDHPPTQTNLNIGSRRTLQEIHPDTIAHIRQHNQLDYELYNYARNRFERDLFCMDLVRPVQLKG